MIHTARFHYIIFLAALGLMVLAFGTFGFIPKLEQIQGLRTREGELQKQLDAKLKMNEKIQRLSTEQLSAVERVAETVKKRIPQEEQPADLLALLSDLAEKDGIENVLFTLGEHSNFFDLELTDEAGNAQAFDGLRAPVTMEFTANFQSLTDFLLNLSHLDRIIGITVMDLRRESGQINVTLELLVFSMRTHRES